MEIKPILKNLGFSDSEVEVYLTVLRLGPSPVRKIAQESEVNRGTCYDILKQLKTQGLVGYYLKNKNQYFMAEDPSKLALFIKEKQENLAKVEGQVLRIIPTLESLYNNAGAKPVVRYFEGEGASKIILEDLLVTMEKETDKQYAAYSSTAIRPYLYKKIPNFTDLRIKNKIAVRVIAFGAGGEEVPAFAQRKWLTRQEVSAPNYILIYSGKVAIITVNQSQEMIGILVEDKSIFETQMILFNSLWGHLN